MADVGSLAWWGALAGLVAPMVIGGYVYVGGLHRPGYNAWQRTMTELGDGADAVAALFPVVNVVVGVLLALFGAWASDALDLPIQVVVLIFVAAGGSAVVGVTACRQACCIPGRRGRPPRWLHPVHLVAVSIILLSMVLVPWLTWRYLRQEPGLDSLRRTSLVAAPLVVIFGAFTVYSSGQQDRGNGAAWVTPGRWERLAWVVGYGWVVVAAGSVLWPSWAWVPGLAWVVVALVGIWWPTGHRGDQAFELAWIQPGILRPLGHASVGRLLVGTIIDPGRFRADLRSARDAAVIGGSAPPDADSVVTFGITYQGLRQLGINYRWRCLYMGDVFADGMARRTHVLGDVGTSEPANWDPEWTCPDRLHVAFWIQARSRGARDATTERVQDRFGDSVEIVVSQGTERIGVGRMSTEHFGFVDGIGQPWVARVQHPTPAMKYRGGKIGPTKRRPKPIELGELVLGQVDETGDIFPLPDPPDLFRNGTYMVVRKLEQDVGAFRDYVAQSSAGSPLTRTQLQDRLIGREPDAQPLAREEPGRPGRNAFDYRDDARGLCCPLGAHVRRANPRDAFGMRGVLANRRRIIRRGMTFGPPYDESPAERRGLLFVCFNARIAEQFEFVLRQWLNDGRPFGLGTNPDPVAGSWPGGDHRLLLIEGSTPTVRATPPTPLVSTRGGEYFFAPSLEGLRVLTG